MKTTAPTLLFFFALFIGMPAVAQEPKTETPKAAGKPGPSAEELEAKFTAALTKATMTGRWCLLKDGKLSPDKDEKYTISSVKKTGDGEWTISARIEYAGLSIDAPVPVQVKWAGDTPVIIVNNLGLPGTAKYSARVMIYGDTYAGTWSGGDHGGLLHGVITREKAEAGGAGIK